jgi:hypothetical protein
MEELVNSEPRVVRHLLGHTYHPDPVVRKVASCGLALAARHHPELIQEVARRLVWAMNDESGANALTAPEVLKTIAEERPEILLPLVPDLTRLTADPGLKEGLIATLKIISEGCPGEVGQSLAQSLNKRFRSREKKF